MTVDLAALPAVEVISRRIVLRAVPGPAYWQVTADRGTFTMRLPMPPLDSEGACGCVGIVPCDLGCGYRWGPAAHRPGRPSMTRAARAHRRDYCHHYHAGTVRSLLEIVARTYGVQHRQPAVVGVPRPTPGFLR